MRRRLSPGLLLSRVLAPATLIFAALIVAALIFAALAGGCSSPSGRAHPGSGGPTSVSSLDARSVHIKTLSTRAGTVGYRSFGQGPPVVLLMGFGGSIDAWPPSFIDALAARYRVITPDNPGVGLTDPLPGPLSASKAADQVSGLISGLGLAKPAVVGWSMGGMIAQALAVEHPDQVSKLVLAATLPGDGHATMPAAAVIDKLKNPSSASAILSLLFPDDSSGTAAATTYLQALFSWPNEYLAGAPAVKAQEQLLASWSSGSDPAGPKLTQISVPTLVADGDEDPLVPLANDQYLASAITGAQLIVEPQSAHAFLFEDQSDFLPKLQQFLG